MVQLGSFRGTIRSVEDFQSSGCVKMVAIEIDNGSMVNFLVGPETYVVDQSMLLVGNQIVGFYDLNAPTLAIYPPRYEAEIIVKVNARENVYVGYFGRNLVSSDNQLRLNISRATRITTANGQQFTQSLMNRFLIVIYGAATKSIPAQVTPSRIIVQC